MKPILILFAHPALEKSRVQYRLVQAGRTVEGVYIHDLYEQYPDFMIDAAREKDLLREHDIILFQYPFYWYSSPALIKEWLDLVLEYGFAYGTGGTELHGKVMLNIISTGGSKSTYRRDGHNSFTIPEFLRPFEQTAYLCGMNYLPPFVIHGTLDMSGAAIDTQAEQYRKLLLKLQTSLPEMDTLNSMTYLNDWLSTQD